MNRSRLVFLALIAGIAIWHWATTGPTPSDAMNAWVQKYELADAKLLNQDVSAMNDLSNSATLSQGLTLCQRSLADVDRVMAQPLPPNSQMKSAYVKFLDARQLAFQDCVQGIETTDPGLLSQAVVANSLADSYGTTFMKLGKKLGFTIIGK